MNNNNIMSNLKISFVLHGCVPGEKIVGDYLLDPIRRSERIRELLIRGLNRMPKADVFDETSLDTKETLNFSVMLNDGVEGDLRFINAYRKIPVSCQKYWLMQRLVAAVNPVNDVHSSKVPPVELLQRDKRALDIDLSDESTEFHVDDVPY